ncbi:MAG TPA: 50S ribosomal protein L32 [Candidatus Magasanikbacteria bacterium]|nr:50S ribosomal protein L32 [Candidatus Magasanikbacteria bacterium]
MGLPSKRRTSRSKRERAAHFALKPVATTKCSECGSVIRPHIACPKCGAYRGKKFVNTAKRLARTVRKHKKSGKK